MPRQFDTGNTTDKRQQSASYLIRGIATPSVGIIPNGPLNSNAHKIHVPSVALFDLLAETDNQTHVVSSSVFVSFASFVVPLFLKEPKGEDHE
jgi:hypothetical protein